MNLPHSILTTAAALPLFACALPPAGLPPNTFVKRCEQSHADGSPAWTTRPPPIYPPEAESAGQTGFVELRYDVNREGVPGNIRVIRGVPEGVFEDAAIASLERWKLCPADQSRSDLKTRIRFDIGFR